MSTMLDLLVITFNCALQAIDVPVFSTHVQTALERNATALPDLVCLSLQEVAPLSSGFIGSWFLEPYYARFADAVNNAAAATTILSSAAHPGPYYTLVRAKHVGYTAILLFARDPAAVRDLQTAGVGVGVASLGNKGAAALRCTYHHHATAETAELTLVAAHLAPMERHTAKRNANWAAIASGLIFGAVPPPRDTAPEQTPLLQPLAQPADASLYRPTAHLVVAGDLNYRTAATAPASPAAFPPLDPASPVHLPTLLPHDQLAHERAAGRTLHGLTEAPVAFPPTYKYKPAPAGAPADAPADVAWTFAPHRWPSWTDRVLYRAAPAWRRAEIRVRAYDALPVVRSSDHRAVFFRAHVPLQTTCSPTASTSAAAAEGNAAALPLPLDLHAPRRRARARQLERVLGWALFLLTTRRGGVVVAGCVALAVTLGAWWAGGAAATGVGRGAVHVARLVLLLLPLADRWVR